MASEKTIDQLVRKFAERFKPEASDTFSVVIHLIITGSEPYVCTLTLTEAGCTVAEGLDGPCDTEIKTKSEVLRRIMNNESSPQQEFIMGQIYVSNLQVVTLVGKSFL